MGWFRGGRDLAKVGENGSQGTPKEPLSELELELTALTRAEHGEPFRLLGPHIVQRDGGQRILVRVIHPYAASISVVVEGHAFPADLVHPGGIFEVLLPPDYRHRGARLSFARTLQSSQHPPSAGRASLP